MNKGMQKAGIAVGAFLTTVAPGLSMDVQRKLRPDAADLGGYLYQAVGRTIEAFGTDRLTMIFMLAASVWLLRRYLFHKPRGTGVGEYLLCGFFSVMMLCCASIRATETVQTLYENAFQLIKVALYLPGMFLIFLCGLRGLNELLHWDWNGVPRRTSALWQKHPFAFPFAVLAIAWLPHVIIKYPGVLQMDSYLPITMFFGTTGRGTNHPPFSTFLYGTLAWLGGQVGSHNAIWFLFTCVQTLCFIAVLSYALWVMNRFSVPTWVRWLALLLFAASPVYVGWSVVIVKDSSYLILCMLAGSMLIEFVGGPESFIKSRWRMALMGACFVLMCVVRHNGITIALPCALLALLVLWRRKAGGRLLTRFAIYACVICLLPTGINEALIHAFSMNRDTSADWMSLMLQQTARVVVMRGDEITPEEYAVIGKVMNYDKCEEFYRPNDADPVKWYTLKGGATEDWRDYRRVWLQMFFRFPMDYVDAALHMNGVLFDLQANQPMYVSLTDNSLDDHVYQYSFNLLEFYEADQIRPLNSLQRALTEYYYRFSDLPLIGQFASMGFCMDVMLAMIYLCWVNGRKRALMVWIPSLVTGVTGLFCPLVYLRYLLPMVGALPLWLAAYFAVEPDMDAALGGGGTQGGHAK